MYRQLLSGIVVASWSLSVCVAAESLPQAAAWIPDNAVLVMELPQAGKKWDRIENGPLQEAVIELPAVKQALESPGFRKFQGGVRYLETMLDTDWRTATRKLLGSGVTLAVLPDGGTLLMMDSEDQELLERLHEVLLGFARGNGQKQGDPDRVSSHEEQGVTVWTFGGKEFHALVGSRFVISNRRSTLTSVLDLKSQSHGPSLAALRSYQASKKRSDAGTVATAFVNLSLVKQQPQLQRIFHQNENPLAALLLGGVLEAFQQADWLSASVHVDGNNLTLTAAVPKPEDNATGPAAFARPRAADQGAWPNLSVPDRIAALTVYRDLHGFYAAKDELFPERTSGLIFFENMMGIFFTGRDLTEEVLAATEPEVRLVVAQQRYNSTIGTPAIQYPAFAAVFRLHNPDQFRDIAEEAWQKALGFVNFTRGQQALPGLIIDRMTQGDTKFSVAYFSAAHEEDKEHLDMRFNFRPALAMVGEYMVLSSTEDLTRDLIDTLHQETNRSVEPLAMTDTRFELDGVQLASILAANRDALIHQNMIEKGHTEAEATAEVGLLLSIVEHFQQFALQLGDPGNDTLQMQIELKANLPN